MSWHTGQWQEAKTIFCLSYRVILDSKSKNKSKSKSSKNKSKSSKSKSKSKNKSKSKMYWRQNAPSKWFTKNTQ